MEHLIRIVNESDRRAVAWLRLEVGEARLEAAARALTGASDTKPYVSAICRYLGVKPLRLVAGTYRSSRAVGDYHLALMRASLGVSAR